MKKLLLIIILLPVIGYSDERSCNFDKSKEVAFTSSNSKEVLRVVISGDNCKESELELTLIKENGEIIHSHKENFSRWYWPGKLQEKIFAYANKLLNESITNSSQLRTDFQCEMPEPNCIPYEKNSIPMSEYLSIKKASVPMIEHQTYYEGWASWVYDVKQQKMIKVYEGGL